MSNSPSPFLDSVRDAIRLRHYSIRTEQAYVDWIKRFIWFHNKRHPKEMGDAEVVAYLTHLAVKGKVAASTQNQALNALVFLYKVVLEQPLDELRGAVRAKKPQTIPVVLTQEEVRQLLKHLDGIHWLAGCLMYGSGLRLMETVRLRVQDLDFPHRAILVRNGKGGKDRVVTLADELITPLQRHLETVKTTHDKDLSDGFGAVYLPFALERKYPAAPKEWGWQYVFPAPSRSVDPRTDIERRHHFGEQSLQRAVKTAVRKASIHKKASCHTLRHYLPFLIMSSAADTVDNLRYFIQVNTT